jgi:cell division protein FtsI/penicillin-binding protein 2
MVFNHKIYSERAKSQQLKAEDIQVRRGNIYDRKGRAFAVNLELESLYCDPAEVVVDKDRLKRLSGILACVVISGQI